MADVTLYLTSWQKRMVRDYVRGTLKSISKVRITSKIPKKEWVMYRVPVFEQVKAGAWNLYLTDEQIARVSEAVGLDAKISALNISPAILESKAVVFE